MRIMSVVGARPNFMKIAPLIAELVARNTLQVAGESGCSVEHYLVHTGQHYDENMSRTFFDALNIPAPDIDLEVGSGTHAEQVGTTMIEFEKIVRSWKPDWIIVVGDVNATCACSIVAKKEQIKLAHIEAGLRSFDLNMPEEINRMVTDRLSDLLFTTSEFANENLRNEGVPEEKIKFVGNIMIDTLEANRAKAEAISIDSILSVSSVTPCEIDVSSSFAVLTLHRPSNVDQKETLEPLVRYLIDEVSTEMPLVWTLHPRTRNKLKEFELLSEIEANENIILLDPVGYLEMLKLNMEASIVLSDSGGLQEECCVIGTPCITLRENTERPATLGDHGGVSVLVGNDIDKIRATFDALKNSPKAEHRPPLWDGRAAERIVDILLGE